MTIFLKIEVGGDDLTERANEIKEKLLANSNLSVIEKFRLQKFKATSGFTRAFYSRHNIKFKNLSGEASGDMRAVNTWFDHVLTAKDYD